MRKVCEDAGIHEGTLSTGGRGSSCKCKHPPGAAETDPASHSSRPTVRPCDLGRSPSQFDSDDQLLEICHSKVRVRVSWVKVGVYCVRLGFIVMELAG